jgi:type IV pilus assembly protein PilC
MTFEYTVRDPLGKRHTGNLEAASREEAVQLLRRDGFQVVTLEEAEEGLSLLPGRIRKAEIIYTASQLAILVETGVTLSAALDGICQQETNPLLRKVLTQLKHDVEAGEDFSTALAKFPQYFDATFVAMMKASEQTGTMGEMLDQAATYMQRELETRQKVRGALAYPAVMLAVAVGVTIFLLTYVLPKFTPLFERKDIKLPQLTVCLMALSKSLSAYWWAWLGGAAAVVIGFLVWRRTPLGQQTLDWVKLHAPVVGSMFRKVAISRSIRTLATMLRGGVPLLEALAIAAEVCGNFFFRRTWLHAMDQITEGNRIRDALTGNPLFPPTLLQMIGSGEETGKLDKVLDRVSRYYDTEVEATLKTTTRMIEPLMIIVMGVVVAGIAFALLLPIFDLSTPKH